MNARSWTSFSVFLLTAVPACGSNPVEGSGTGTESSGSSGSETTDAGSESGGVCTPGASIQCACPSGDTGAQVCNVSGSGYEPCVCDGTSNSGTSDAPTTGGPTSTTNVTATTDVSTTDVSTTTTGDTTTTTGDTTTTGTTDASSTTGMNGACADIVTFELQPSDAIMSGAWAVGMSMLGEGEIATITNPQNGTDGSILYTPDIPCDDTWYIWVRALDQGQNDSYFATLDGEPNPAAIFEGDCTQNGNSYKWAALNWRDQGAQACNYVENPWAPMWTAGTHEIEFEYREVQGMGRILITNDPDLVPAP